MDFRDILLQLKTATHIEEFSGLIEELVEMIPQTAVMVGYHYDCSKQKMNGGISFETPPSLQPLLKP